eukprot:UN08228
MVRTVFDILNLRNQMICIVVFDILFLRNQTVCMVVHCCFHMYILTQGNKHFRLKFRLILIFLIQDFPSVLLFHVVDLFGVSCMKFYFKPIT